MRRKRVQEEPVAANWYATFADMITLLMTFFVLLFAISSVNEKNWEILVKTLGTGSSGSSDTKTGTAVGGGTISEAGGDIPNSPEEIRNFDDLYYYLKGYIEENNLESDVSLYKGNGYTFITFRNNILFDGDSDVLKSDGRKILDVLAGAIQHISGEIGHMYFEGHTAHVNDETIKDIYFDRVLSTNRAVNALIYFQTKNAINPKKMIATGYGEYEPRVENDGSEASRIINRRVEINITKEGTSSMSLEEIYKQIDEAQSKSN